MYRLPVVSLSLRALLAACAPAPAAAPTAAPAPPTTDVLLVRHSYGGMVVSGVADNIPERIQHLVFLDACQPFEERPFTLTYIVATERPNPAPPFDQTAKRLRASPRWTVREIPGGHSMQLTNPNGLAGLLLELFAGRVPASV